MVFALYIQDRRIFHGELTTQNRNSYFQQYLNMECLCSQPHRVLCY